MAKPEIRNYSKSIEQVFVAAQKAVRDLGYKIEKVDKESGLVSFKTGMSWRSWGGQDMSVMLIDNGNGTVEVSVTGRRNESKISMQVYDWGEAGAIAKKVFAKMDPYLQQA